MQHWRFIVILAPLICVLAKRTSQGLAHNAGSELYCATGDGNCRIDMNYVSFQIEESHSSWLDDQNVP